MSDVRLKLLLFGVQKERPALLVVLPSEGRFEEFATSGNFILLFLALGFLEVGRQHSLPCRGYVVVVESFGLPQPVLALVHLEVDGHLHSHHISTWAPVLNPFWLAERFAWRQAGHLACLHFEEQLYGKVGHDGPRLLPSCGNTLHLGTGRVVVEGHQQGHSVHADLRRRRPDVDFVPLPCPQSDLLCFLPTFQVFGHPMVITQLEHRIQPHDTNLSFIGKNILFVAIFVILFSDVCHLFHHNTDLARFSILLFLLKVSFPKRLVPKRNPKVLNTMR